MAKLFVFLVFLSLFVISTTNAAGICYEKQRNEERFTAPGKNGLGGCAVTLEKNGDVIIFGSTYVDDQAVTHTRWVIFYKIYDLKWRVVAGAEHAILDYDYRSGFYTMRVPTGHLLDAIKVNKCTVCFDGLPKPVQRLLVAWANKDRDMPFSEQQEYILQITKTD